MRIGYDAKRLFHNTTGLGQYSRTLLKDIVRFHSEQENVLFSLKIKDSRFEKEFGQGEFKKVDLGKWGNLKRTLGYSELINAHKIDVFHGLSNELPWNIKRCKIPTIVTIHDVIFRVLPATYNSFDRAIYNYKTRMACKNADVIVAISEHTKRDLVKYFDIDKDRIKVIYQSCHDRFKLKSESYVIPRIVDKLPNDYFIQVGSINHRKNLLNTLLALSEIPKKDRPHLVVVGRGSGVYYEKVTSFIEVHDMQKSVHLFDNIEDDELPYLYHHARCSIYVSNYEGFGIPVIESLFCGTPVITSTTSSMPEALGPCGALVNPIDILEIKEAILNPPELDEQQCEQHLKLFDSKKITYQWIQMYESSVKLK